MNRIRVGIAQINPIVGDFPHNVQKIIRLIGEAEKKKLDWVIFSELALCGYPVWDLALKEAFVRDGLSALKKVAAATRGKKITVILGFIDRGPSDTYKNYNALAVLHNGRVVHKQYKTLLPTYDVFLEQIFFAPAKEQKIFKWKGVPVGVSICEDIWDEEYSVKPTQELAKQGARVIVNISASPYHCRVGCVRDHLITTKARQMKAFVVYVNQVGGQDDLIFDGRSLVSSPQGDILFRGGIFEEALYEIDLDLEARNFAKASQPRIPLVPRGPHSGNVHDVYEALKTGIRDYVRKNGFRRVVIGLSGGIDSALTAALAVDALGPEAVIGVAMPGEFSSEASYTDAVRLAQNLKIELRVHSIVQRYRQFLDETVHNKKNEGREAGEWKEITLAMENLQSRLRGLNLMYVSNDENAMLLSTGNKSELAMGYCTLYGDMSGGLCALGDVYKTEVYRLVKYRNSLGPVIPEKIIRKAPTAELRPNQKDEDSLPKYEILDRILYHYIEEDLGRDEIVRLFRKEKVRVKPSVVHEVIDRVDHNEYKRRQAPPILRVTEKAWFGRRMPITNHFRG